jgi:hypothetical protein
MSRILTIILALALATLVFVSIPVAAANGSITIGANDNNSRYPTGLDPSANGTSFPNFQAGGTYQQVYSKTAFTGPVTITQIAFASHELTSAPGTANYNFNISVGATAATPNALSTNLAANRGAQMVQVFTGPVTANITDGAQFDVLINVTPFTYDPANGNLLVEFTFNSAPQFSGGSLLYFRAGADSRTSRAANPAGVVGGAFTDNFGLLTRFTTQSNSVPNAVDDVATVNEDSGANPISVLANDTDQDNDTLAITAVTQGAHGLVAITGGGSGLTYTPADDYAGPDTFTYTISDGHGGSDTANVNVSVNAVNDPPSFTKGADQTVNEDAGAKTVNNWASNISAGPANESSQTLNFIVTNDNNQLFSNQPSVASDGTLVYKPAANAFGVATVSVKLHDNGGGQDTSAAQTFKITVKPVADLPTATPANTTVGTQTTTGLVIDRNPVDGPEVTHFRIFSITNGHLFQHDGVTEIQSGDVITVDQGKAGLRFTPDPDLFSPQSFFFFVVSAGVGPAPADFGPGGLTVGIGVTCTEAQVFVVSNGNDSGPGSLRDVLNNACSGGKVTFDMSPGHVTSPIILTSGELAVGQDQTIAGPTDTSLVISGNNSGRVFNVNWWQANLKISNLTIADGKANSGAGIRSEGSLTIKDSTLTGNNAEGTDGSGGAIDTTFNSHLSIINSTISGNTAQGYGGGLRNLADNATLINVTITNNRADSDGTGSEYDGGMIQLGSHMNLRNSIVAGNFKGTGNTVSDLTGNSSDPYAAISRNNLIGVNDDSTGLDPATNLLGTLANPINPLLDPLAANGGPTRTHLLSLGSPAIKAGVNDPADGITTDQRGFGRAASGPIDIGAVEVGYAINATGGTPQSATIGSTFAAPLQATVTESGIPLSGVLVTFAAPKNGASGTFSGNATVLTDSNGVATAPAFTANSNVGGPYNVTATQAGISTSAVFALTNTAATAQVTLSNLVQTFDGTPKSVSVSSNPAGLNVAVTYNGSATPPTNAGSYPVIATVTDPSFIGEANGTLIIQRANQQITFGALPNRTVGDADFNVIATASSNLAVSFSAGGNCSVTGAQVQIMGGGSCTITASQDGNPNFNPATPVSREFTIARLNQQITFKALPDKKFGDADFVLSASTPSKLTVSFSASGNCSVTGTQVHINGAGQCTITASQDGNSDYNPATPVARAFTINKADQQITFEALPDKKFGDADFNVIATASSNLAVSFSAGGNCTVTGTLVHITGAGSCTITASQDGNSDYNPATAVIRTVTIARADQQITFEALPDQKFGDADFNVIATATSNLAVNFSASGNCTLKGAQVHITGGGACTITASQDGNTNYNPATAVARTFTISKANQQITFEALPDKKFGDADFNVSATSSSNLPASFSASGNCSLTGTQVHITGAGACTITASQDGNSDYNPATAVARTFTTNKADQQITFDNLANKTVGDADFMVSATASSHLAVGFAAAGSCSMTGAQVHLTGAGQCTITASQDGNANYNAATPLARMFTITDQANNQTLFSFGSSVYKVTESVGVVHITVTRSGDTSGPSTVDYATDDTNAAVDCAKVTGLASARCDFNTAIGTLTFATGETEKSFDVLINQDSYVEAPFETFTVKLSNPTGGATLGTISVATVEIHDSSAGVSPSFNINDDTRAFVRQQYHDFLNREPDRAGLAFWVDNIDGCNDPARRPSDLSTEQCKQVMRINTSAAFFLSIEFSQSGGMVQAFYAAALDRPNNRPGYLEFIRDNQAVGRGVVVGEGNWQQTLNENRAAFMQDFVSRPEFVGLYPTADAPASYVNKLYLHALGRQPGPAELGQALNEFGGSLTAADPGARARVLLQVTKADDFDIEINRSFVQMQYIGYLRRNPNELPDTNFDGYDFWLNKLNRFHGNFIEAEMVGAFIESGEYRARFGP